MSRRTEEAAMKAYPSYVEIITDIVGKQDDLHEFAREVFEDGYKQAEKDTIERAVKWLEENVWESTGLDFQILTESFKNAMK